MKHLRNEPALTAGITAAALALLVSYGVLDKERASLWEGLLIIIIPVAQAWWTRRKVMPVAKIEDAGLNPTTISHRAEVANGGSP